MRVSGLTASAKSCLFVACGVAALAPVSKAAVLYRETFGNKTAAQTALSTTGWTVNAHSTGDDITNPKTGSQDAADSNIAGRPADLDNVNAGTSTSTSLGVVFVTNSGGTVKTSDPVLFWTSEFTLDRSANTITDFSFYMGNQQKTDSLRVAIQIGSSWYVSNTSFFNTVAVSSGTDFPTKSELETLNFSTAASAWSTLNFVAATSTATGSLAVGSTLTSALPSGNITAFGLYSGPTRGGNVRFDTFTVDATPTPEPASLGLAAAGAVLAMRRRRVAR